MFRKKPTIKIVSTVPGLEMIEECLPIPAVKAIPEWWKKTKLIPRSFGRYNDIVEETTFSGNVKTCPSFPDYFSQGYIIPMWADTILRYDIETSGWSWNTPDARFKWDVHSHKQYLDDVDHDYLNNSGKVLFKAISPWKIITPPGYSVLQLPTFYHFNNDFTVLPGIIDTDIHYEINQQVMYLSNEPEIFIKRGTPLVQYIPFKREKYNYEVKLAGEKENKLFLKQDMTFFTKFPGSHQYQALRKNRDSNKKGNK